MKRSTSRWTTAIAAAALLGVPAATFAQSQAQTPASQTQTTSSQPPTSSQQPTSQQPTSAQPPASTSGTQSTTGAQSTQPSAEPSAQAPAAQDASHVNAAAAKQALSDARDSLAQLASMPEAAKLQGESRTQVSQLISNFNELITTQANWKDAYSKVENSLNALIGPETGATEPSAAGSMAGTAGTTGAGTTAATGTSGSAATPATPSSASAAGEASASSQIDPAIRAKLLEFRTHLKAFEQAAGGTSATTPSAASTEPSASSAASSSASNPSSAASNPSSPASTSAATETSAAGTTASSAQSAQPTSSQPAEPTSAAQQSAVGTSGTSAPTATDARSAESQTQANRELDAIQAILAQAKNGRLDKAEIDQLKTHVEQLRQLIGGSK
jgi:hypothetical protein